MSTGGGSKGAHRTAQFVELLEAKLNQGNDLAARMKSPLVFIPPVGGNIAYGLSNDRI